MVDETLVLHRGDGFNVVIILGCGIKCFSCHVPLNVIHHPPNRNSLLYCFTFCERRAIIGNIICLIAGEIKVKGVLSHL